MGSQVGSGGSLLLCPALAISSRPQVGSAEISHKNGMMNVNATSDPDAETRGP